MPIFESITEALRGLNPSRPASAAQYVTRDWPGMARAWDAPDRLRALLAADYTVRIILHGAIGVGKTSELLYWQRRLGGEVFVVPGVFVRDDRHSPEVDLVRWTARRLQVRLADSDNAAHQALAATIEADLASPESALSRGKLPDLQHLVETVEAELGRRVLLLLDGTDRLTDAEAAFLFRAASPLCHPAMPSLVVVAPHAFATLAPGSELDPRFQYRWNLPAFGVRRADGSDDEAAVEALATGLQRRVAGLAAFPDDLGTFRDVARWSGGIPRDAVRILHAALLAGASVGRINARHLQLGMLEVRQDLVQSLRTEDWSRLREVARTHNHEGAADLIGHNTIVAYEGVDQRYWLPHPLLQPLLAERA